MNKYIKSVDLVFCLIIAGLFIAYLIVSLKPETPKQPTTTTITTTEKRTAITEKTTLKPTTTAPTTTITTTAPTTKKPTIATTEKTTIKQTAKTTKKSTKKSNDGNLKSLGVFSITAYCPCYQCSGGHGRNTATGNIATAGRTIAVDPSVIPYGTRVIINGHEYVAEDCGSAVKSNVIDIFFDTHSEAENWGRRSFEVFVSD